MQIAGDPLDAAIQWVKPALIAELRFIGWSGAGRVRHAVFLGLREDKTQDEIIRPLADPGAPRRPIAGASRRASRTQSPPQTLPEREMHEMHLTHPDRELWPGITKRDLAAYWQAVATWALPGIADRPLALVRCPDGIGGQHFFQKHAGRGFPSEMHEGKADGAPYVALHDADGLIACAQIAAIELHAWGSTEADPLHPDRLVFDLDPGEGVPFPEVVAAAKDLRARLEDVGLGAFCRTTGGKGLHVVVPLRPGAAWDAVRPWCRAFAEAVATTAPDRYLTTLLKKDRQGRILIDWLRNGLGSTAVASFSPRARPGATVATPLAWREVTARLDPARFTIVTVPKRLETESADPWAEWPDLARPLPVTKKARR
jgi:bifunctional non-homologous end joining protein LigD